MILLILVSQFWLVTWRGSYLRFDCIFVITLWLHFKQGFIRISFLFFLLALLIVWLTIIIIFTDFLALRRTIIWWGFSLLRSAFSFSSYELLRCWESWVTLVAKLNWVLRQTHLVMTIRRGSLHGIDIVIRGIHARVAWVLLHHLIRRVILRIVVVRRKYITARWPSLIVILTIRLIS